MYKEFLSPIASLSLLAVGLGLTTTLQTLSLHDMQVNKIAMGVIIAAYYLGFLLSAFQVEKLILRISHIRAYAAFASLLTALTIVQGFFPSPLLWLVLRLLSGFCVAGLFVVIESWMLCKSTNETRGRCLSLYMISYYGAQSLGQLLLHYKTTSNADYLFSMSAVLFSISILPLAITKVSSPEFETSASLKIIKLVKLSPSGTIGSFTSGMILGPLYGLMPLIILELFGANQVAIYMFLIIMGGMLFQYPIGKFSDFYDRRIILGLLFAITALLFFILIMTPGNLKSLSLLTCFLLGGSIFAIYPVSMSHACDTIETNQLVSVTQSLVLINSAGMIIGPLVASLLMVTNTIYGYVTYMIVLSLLMSPYFFWRKKVGKPVDSEHHQDFVVLPRTTPLGMELDPRIEEKNHP